MPKFTKFQQNFPVRRRPSWKRGKFGYLGSYWSN